MSSIYQELRLEGRFCDAVLKVQHIEFQVHKVILCNCSSYFRALFRRWSPWGQRIFEVADINPEIMGLIIEFAYTGSCSVTVTNMMDLISTADMLNILDLVQACSLFMEQQLCPNNCISIWNFTRNCSFSDLQSKAYHYILVYFDKVVFSEELLLLTVEDLINFFSRDDLRVRTETTVFEAMIRWINHMPEQRKTHLRELMSKIRLCLLGVEYLTENVQNNDLVKTDATCLFMVIKAFRLLSQRSNDPGNIGFSNYFLRPRLPSAILLATGGWTRGNPTNAIEAYDIGINRWVSVEAGAEQPRAYHGTAFLDSYIYVVGGFDREEFFRSVRRFDPVRYIWEEMSPMKRSRCYVSVTTLNGFIYALGGYNGRLRLSSAECYQPQTNEWNFISSMHEERSDASCTTFQGMIYVCGGFNGFVSLPSAEYYNPLTDRWTMISHMTSPRSGLGVVVYRDCLYAVGGNNGSQGTNRLRTVEVYNSWNNTWTEISPMRTTRSNFGIEVIDDRIFVAGGFDGDSTSTAVESYDATLGVWTAACDMEVPRSALSCCVIYGLPNMRKYTMKRDSLQMEEVEEQEDQ